MNIPNYLRTIWLISERYLLFAAIAFGIYYVVFRKKFFYQKIQKRFPTKADYVREIGYSFLSICIFAFISLAMLTPPVVHYTTRYLSISDHGWGYYSAVYPVLFVMHDTYFYFTHRLMHHKKIFKWFHLVHHQSTNPSPWAAYSFHPLEAIVEAGILPVFLFTIPVHVTHIVFFMLMMIMYNIYGHLGYELYPKGFSKHRIGKWINTSINHNQHHQYFKGNYGLYFLFWDRMLGTIRPDYDQKFEQVKTRERAQEENGGEITVVVNA